MYYTYILTESFISKLCCGCNKFRWFNEQADEFDTIDKCNSGFCKNFFSCQEIHRKFCACLENNYSVTFPIVNDFWKFLILIH